MGKQKGFGEFGLLNQFYVETDNYPPFLNKLTAKNARLLRKEHKANNCDKTNSMRHSMLDTESLFFLE